MKKYAYYLTSIVELFGGIRNWPVVLQAFLRRGAPGIKVIQLRKSGVRLGVRGPMDIWIAKETYLDRFYERYGTPIGDGWAIVDVGAGIGDWSIYAAWNHPTNQVFAFEPFPESIELLRDNLRLNGIANVQAFPEAISGHSGSLALDLSSGEPLQFSTEAMAASGETLSVPSLSLADALKRLGIDRCDLLKLDCEGAEYDILFEAPDQVFGRIERLVMEYHDGVTRYTHHHLVEFLTGKGFRVQTHSNPVHDHLGFLYAVRA